MTREDAKREIKSRYAEYLTPAKKRVNGKPTYICPLLHCGNGSGQDGDGMAVDPHGDGTQLKCFKCGFYGDIIDLYRAEHQCDYGEAFRALYERFGIEVDKPTEWPLNSAGSPQSDRTMQSNTKAPLPAENAPEGKIEAVEDKQDYTTFYEHCNKQISDPEAQAYLSLRGISKETAERYNLGYELYTRALIIPVSQSFYVQRFTDPNAKVRYINAPDSQVELFNTKALQNDTGRPVFITEGAIDALSIIEAGGEAVALNSTSNTRKLLEKIRTQRTRSTLILCLDNDAAGAKATAELETGLKELNISYITADICGEYKDPNEALKADRMAFFDAVKATERRTSKPDNTSDYISLFMAGEIEKLKENATRKTGFSNLDAETGGVYPGLYAVGGISSVGKTTFIYQMADQMAAAGQHVLFFSMEQSRLEMVSKSIARTTAQADINTAVSSIAIRTGTLTPVVLDAADRYSQTVGGRLSVIEGNFNCTVSFIGEYTRKYIENNGVKPVIIVDYLQVLRPEKDPETGRKPTDTKQVVDYNVTQLKRMSRALDIPVFVISSLNRSNYLTPVDFEAFKESGGIEYTADVVWGLQLDVMNDPIFDKEKGVKEKREKVRDAKAAIPREIELVCLKNRYGRSYNVHFRYYPQYDLFMPYNP